MELRGTAFRDRLQQISRLAEPVAPSPTLASTRRMVSADALRSGGALRSRLVAKDRRVQWKGEVPSASALDAGGQYECRDDRFYGMLGLTAVLNHAVSRYALPVTLVRDDGTRCGFWGRPPLWKKPGRWCGANCFLITTTKHGELAC